jgi:hypothetical protein
MAEWLGSALQKLLQRFESASDLQPQKAPSKRLGFFCAQNLRPSSLESEAKGAKTASAPCGALELSGVESSPCPGIVARRAAIPYFLRVQTELTMGPLVLPRCLFFDPSSISLIRSSFVSRTSRSSLLNRFSFFFHHLSIAMLPRLTHYKFRSPTTSQAGLQGWCSHLR